MTVITRSIRRDVIFALRVLDDCTLRPIEGGLQFWIDDKPYTPLRKQGGIYVFMNIEKESFALKVVKPTYFDDVVQIQKEAMNPLDEVLSIRLIPTPQYPFRSDATLIRFKIDPQAMGDENCKISGYISDASYYHGRISKNIVKNKDQIKAVPVYGPFRAGDTFHMQGEEGSEFISLKKVMDNESVLLDEPVHYTYKQGIKLYKAKITQADSNGYGVMYFNELHQGKINVKLSIETKSGNREVDVLVEEGKSVHLGIISIERRE